MTLLLDADTWVVSPRIGRTLGGFHHMVDLRLTGMRQRRYKAGRWVYPLLDAAIIAVGLEEVEMYVLCRNNTIAHYIVTCPIMELCLVAEQRPGSWLTQQWWEQAGLNFGKEAGRAA